MYCPKEMKLNKFQNVRIPSGKELFGRFGMSQNPTTGYTGEEYVENNQTKLQQLADYDAYDKMMQKEENKKAAEAAAKAKADAEELAQARAAKQEQK